MITTMAFANPSTSHNRYFLSLVRPLKISLSNFQHHTVSTVITLLGISFQDLLVYIEPVFKESHSG